MFFLMTNLHELHHDLVEIAERAYQARTGEQPIEDQLLWIEGRARTAAAYLADDLGIGTETDEMEDETDGIKETTDE